MKRLARLLLLVLLAACSKLTLENYDKIKSGMTYAEVKTLLGAPENCNDVIGVKTCRWGDEKRSVSVSFIGDKVFLFSAENLR